MSNPLNVLIVAESEQDALPMVRELNNGSYDVKYLRIDTPEEMIEALKKQKWDIILTDYRLPHFNAPHALELLQDSKQDIPFIVVSSQVGEEAAVQIMREGAHDFLMKDNLTRLAPAVERELNEVRLRQESREMQDDLLIAEQSFRNTLDNSPLGIRIVTADGELLYANKAILDIYGYDSVEELETTPIRKRYTPASYAEHKERTRQRSEGKPVPPNYEISIINKSGDIRHLLVSRKVVVWRGEVQYQVIYQDITERKQLEDLYMTIARGSPIGVYIVQDNHFRFVNPQFVSLSGYTEEELLNMAPLDIVHTEDREKTRENAIRMLKGETHTPYEFRITRADGETRWSMETVSSIFYEGKRATLGNFMDITERKELEEKLIVTNHLASIGELSSGIAHELNNPLTAVIGFTDLLLTRDVEEDIRGDLEIINREAKRTARVVKNLLTFARGHPEEKENVDINNIIKSVLDLRSYEQKVNNIEVTTRLSDNLPSTFADAFQLQQVFFNIIINAEYFMIEEHGKGKLKIATTCDNGVIKASFTDDGPGITPENVSHLFNPFFTTKEVGKGTGLGLSISYGIVTQHGGQIYAQSTLGKGATFTVELPVTKNDDGAAEV